jgi:hypothetical protein
MNEWRDARNDPPEEMMLVLTIKSLFDFKGNPYRVYCLDVCTSNAPGRISWERGGETKWWQPLPEMPEI